jgi:hypothetical protein
MRKGYQMKVEVEMKDTVCHKWWLVAKFDLGTHAMEAARALSEADGGVYRVLDKRWPDDGVEAIVYEAGVAS